MVYLERRLALRWIDDLRNAEAPLCRPLLMSRLQSGAACVMAMPLAIESDRADALMRVADDETERARLADGNRHLDFRRIDTRDLACSQRGRRPQNTTQCEGTPRQLSSSHSRVFPSSAPHG